MTLVVKLGSSIVAADDGDLRTDVLDSVCEQVATLERGGERVVMVTSGAIARGMRLMGLPVRPRAMDELQAASAVGQGDLFRAYESRLAEHGTRSAQVLLTAADIAARTNYLAAQVAILLDARLLVLLTNTDGLFTADPGVDREAKRIPDVTDFSELAGMEIGDRTSVFGSGGMRSKVAAAEMASEAGIVATICNGTSGGTLAAAAAGDPVGTRFAAQDSKASSFKLWLKYAKPAHGRLVVDGGAARVLRESGSSLLPVGITNVEGDFQAGDAVDVTVNGSIIGKGMVDYSAAELSEVIGLKSAEVRERMPHAADEVIHRDRFVLV